MSIRDFFGRARIPTPSSIMSDLIALRIAQFPADPDAPYKANGSMIELRLQDGRKIEVRFGEVWHHGRRSVTVSAGMPGPPSYRTVTLTPEEQEPILREVREWQRRSLALRDAQRAVAEQETALDIVEGLI